jgi:antitoxin ParD1/3/4
VDAGLGYASLTARDANASKARRFPSITLNPDQEAQIKTRVASGDFASVEEAARQLIDEALAERALDESDDLAWAKPYVDEALAEVARGEEIPLEEHKARNAARLAALRT